MGNCFFEHWRCHRCLSALAKSEGGWPEHVLELLCSTDLAAVTEHPLFFREPGDCEVYGRGCVTLLGDAAHLTAAALGQVSPYGVTNKRA